MNRKRFVSNASSSMGAGAQVRGWPVLGLALGLVAVAGGCRDRAATRKPAAAPVAIDAGPPRPVDAALTVRQRMDDHFGAIAQIERAVMRGQLAEARDAAAALRAHTGAALDVDAPFVAAVRAAAADVEAAPDLPRAAAHAATLALQCARCHTARAVKVAFPWTSMPPDDGSIEARMRRHQWGAARMWEGLVGPVDELWREGAGLIAGTDLDALAEVAAPDAVGVRALVAQIRALAQQAAAVTTAEDRAPLYGQLLVACAGCHLQARPASPP